LPENVNTSRDAGPAATAPAVAATTSGATYTINPMVSRFTVKAFASGMLSAFGHDPTIAIRDLQGEAHFAPDDIPHSSLHLVVRADSLALTDNVSDKDRRQIETEMRDNVLETGKYPEIVYDAANATVQNNSDGQIDVVLQGQLSLHGVSRPQKVPARIVVTGEMLRAFGEFTLRQTDFNIKPVSAVGGGLKVKDEVRFSFDIVARK
jgi:polyisoprenoid-binding protein YceI